MQTRKVTFKGVSDTVYHLKKHSISKVNSLQNSWNARTRAKVMMELILNLLFIVVVEGLVGSSRHPSVTNDK